MNLNALCSAGIGPYLVDIVIAAIIVIFVFLSARKGFITCFFGFISSLAVLFIAISLAKVTADITGGLFGLRDTLEVSLTESFSKLNGFDVVIDPNADLGELLAKEDMSAILVNLIAQNYDVIPAGSTLAILAGETVASLAVTLIAGIVLFIGLKLLFKLLKGTFNFIAEKISLLNMLNRLLGATVGLIEIILLISVFVAVLSLFPDLMPFLNGSVILTALYNSNPLMWMLSWFF